MIPEPNNERDGETKQSAPTLSVVSTLYFSEPYLQEFYQRVTKVASDITDNFEVILVNDGSPDRSLELAKEICERDDRVRVINLSRNFGHHKAILTGLSYAHGEFVFVIDCDLEESPELLWQYWLEMSRSPEVDVVYGVQGERKGGWLERHLGRWFYIMFNAVSDMKIPLDTVIARLMRRSYVANLVGFREQDVVLSGIYALAGYNHRAITVKKMHKRASTYTLSRKLDMLVNAITSFTARPLVWIFYAGVLIMAVSLMIMALLAYKKMVLGIREEGWTSVIASVWFFGGLIVFCQGIIGVYLAKIFVQVKNRPFTIVRDQFGNVGGTTRPATGRSAAPADEMSELSFAPPAIPKVEHRTIGD